MAMEYAGNKNLKYSKETAEMQLKGIKQFWVESRGFSEEQAKWAFSKVQDKSGAWRLVVQSPDAFYNEFGTEVTSDYIDLYELSISRNKHVYNIEVSAREMMAWRANPDHFKKKKITGYTSVGKNSKGDFAVSWIIKGNIKWDDLKEIGKVITHESSVHAATKLLNPSVMANMYMGKNKYRHYKTTPYTKLFGEVIKGGGAAVGAGSWDPDKESWHESHKGGFSTADLKDQFQNMP